MSKQKLTEENEKEKLDEDDIESIITSSNPSSISVNNNISHLPGSEQKKQHVQNMLSAYQNAHKSFSNKEYTKAAEYFASAIKPVLSKPMMKGILLTDAAAIHQQMQDSNSIESKQSLYNKVLDSMYHLGKCYLQDTSYQNHYAKAAAIFQYCAKFANKHKLSTMNIENAHTFLLKQAYLVEQSFLHSINSSSKDTVADSNNYYTQYHQTISKYKSELEKLRTETKDKLEKISDLTVKNIAKRAKAVEDIYQHSSNFFVTNNDEDATNTTASTNSTNGAGQKKLGLIQQLIKNCQNQLGTVPEGCVYSIIGLGSISDGKMTPYSDLEFAILINENKAEYQEYFTNLTKLLHIKIINFGETMLRSVGIESLNNFKTGKEEDEWFWDDVMKSGFSLDGAHWHACKLPFGRQGYEGKKDYGLILTPDQMALFQSNTDEQDTNNQDNAKQNQHDWFESDEHLVQSLRNVSLIGGSQALLDTYKAKLHDKKTIKHTTVKQRALKILQDDLIKYKLKLGDKEEGKLYDVKKDIYRLGDRILDALTDYYGIGPKEEQPSMTIWQKIEKMHRQELLSKDGANHLKEAISIATELRLNAYCKNGSQTENIQTFIPAVSHLHEEEQKKLVEETFHVKDTSILHHFYYVMLGLQEILTAFCDEDYYHNQAKLILKDSPLLADSNYNKGMVHARFLEYTKALQFMEVAKKEDYANLQILEGLLLLYNKTQTLNKTTDLAKDILKLKKIKYKDDPNHPDIANSYQNMGSVYSGECKHEAAIEQYNLALNIYRETYKSSPDHPNIASTYNNIGIIYRYIGLYDKAIKQFNEALHIRLVAYASSPNHSDVAESYNNLGAVYKFKGEYKYAIEQFNEALHIRLKAYASRPNHPDIAESYNNLGAAYNDEGEYEEAIKKHNIALNIQLKTYKSVSNHPDIAVSFNNLGNAYQKKGDLNKAFELYNKALDIRKKAYKSNPNHPDVANSYNNIGSFYQDKGLYDKAIEQFNEALHIRLKAYKSNPNHPDIASSYNNLGAVYFDKNNYDQAFELYNKALDIRMKAFKDRPGHPDIASSYNNLGNINQIKGEYDEAIKNHMLVLNIWNKTYKNNLNHPNIANSYNNLGNAYICKNDYNQAIKYYKLALNIRMKTFKDSPHHPDIASSYDSLGTAFCSKNDYDKAINLYHKALNIRQSNLNHLGIASTHNNLGNAYVEKGEYDKAIEHHQKALAIRSTAYATTPNHPDIAKYQNNLNISIQNKKIDSIIQKTFNNQKVKYQESNNDLEIKLPASGIKKEYLIEYCKQILKLNESDITISDDNTYSITLNSGAKSILRDMLALQNADNQPEDNSNNHNQETTTTTISSNNNCDDNSLNSVAVTGDINTASIDSDTPT